MYAVELDCNVAVGKE